MIRCIHHDDLDGRCSAAIVGKFEEGRVEFIPFNYGDELPFFEDPGLNYYVDISFHKKDVEEALKRKENVIWIDHHKTSIENDDSRIRGLRESTAAGCLLTWMFLLKEEKIPFAVQLVSDYDIWNHYNPIVMEFYNGISSMDTTPDSWIWKVLLEGSKPKNKMFLHQILQNGKVIEDYLIAQREDFLKKNMFTGTFNGKKALFLNDMFFKTKAFDSFTEKDKYDIIVLFLYNGKEWDVSLRSLNDNADVEVIAKKYGGGGHKRAAGFKCKDIYEILMDATRS